MGVVHVIFEATIVLMLGSILFHLQKSKEANHKTSQAPQSLVNLGDLGDLKRLSNPEEMVVHLREIRQILQDMASKEAFTLPWTNLMEGTLSREEAVVKLFEAREGHDLSMMEEMEFQSCAQLVVLSFLAQSVDDDDGGSTSGGGTHQGHA